MSSDVRQMGKSTYGVVRSIPIHGLPRPAALPLLFLENDSGDVVLHREAFAYAKACLAAYELGTIARDIETVRRLHDFYRVFWPVSALPEDRFDYLVYAYLAWRHCGTLADDGTSRLGGLRWSPLAFDGLRAEFLALNRYIRFCSRTWGYVWLGTIKRVVRPEGLLVKRLQTTAEMKQRDFFVHLGAAREYWAQQFNNRVDLPPIATPARGRSGSLQHVMPEEEIWRIIDNERNPVYRAIWVVGAFGGIRISEQLNTWQCDVLPSSSRQLLFQYDGGENILFLRADPINSRYLGDLGRAGITREQHLRSQYGLSPRCRLSRNDPLYAGWKGTLYLHKALLLNEVFWLNQQAMMLFAQCAEEVREFHRMHKTSERHPYFYVNMASRSSEHLGQPLKISNVEAAWDRACRRCNLEPHRWGRHIHGLRHFYKLLARSMGVSADEIQIMMGHKRYESQDSYGRTARDIATRLTKSAAGVTEASSRA